ncbi:MAG: hypothetical protein ABSA09_01485 [Desulfobaccales bacterium]|jgi:hypothetical protein
MTFDEIKAAVRDLDDQGKKRVVMELLPEIWPKIIGDEACLEFIRKMVDEEAVRQYKEEHMDGI